MADGAGALGCVLAGPVVRATAYGGALGRAQRSGLQFLHKRCPEESPVLLRIFAGTQVVPRNSGRRVPRRKRRGDDVAVEDLVHSVHEGLAQPAYVDAHRLAVVVPELVRGHELADGIAK